MRAIALSVVATLTSAKAPAARPPPSVTAEQVGLVYEVSKDVETVGRGSDGSSDSSSDTDVILERVTRVTDDGIEWEYYLPKDTPPQERSDDWQFPFRVFKPYSGAAKLVDKSALERRASAWLRKAGLNAQVCGHYVFTWNAFKIDCDPGSALAIAASFDLGPTRLDDGSVYTDPLAVGPIALHKAMPTSDQIVFEGKARLDTQAVRDRETQADVAAGEITSRPISIAEAQKALANEQIAGTVSVSFGAGPDGIVRQRVKVTDLTITRPNGVVERRTTTEVLKRRIASGTWSVSRLKADLPAVSLGGPSSSRGSDD